jgi:hypothetical protein
MVRIARDGRGNGLDSITNNMATIFADVVTGTKSMKDAFMEFSKSTVRSP